MNWWALTKLHEVFNTSSTIATEHFLKDDTINHFLSTGELIHQGKHIIINEVLPESFKSFYKTHYLQNYLLFDSLLSKYGLKKPQSRYDEQELKILLKLDQEMANGSISHIRQQIIDQEESIRGVSRMFFNNDEKYLDDKEDVVYALKKVLQISHLANDKAQQWMYKLTHPNRILIVLCENLDFLRRPTLPLKHNIELWYAGGRNTPKLERERVLIDKPIYYLCDWDHDGIDIYFEAKAILPRIQLLTPVASPIKLSDSPNHSSLWNDQDKGIILSTSDFILSHAQKQLILNLIRDETWIREEDNNLIEILKANGAIVG